MAFLYFQVGSHDSIMNTCYLYVLVYRFLWRYGVIHARWALCSIDRWHVIEIAKPCVNSFFPLLVMLHRSQRVQRKPVSRFSNQADKTVKDKNWTNEWQPISMTHVHLIYFKRLILFLFSCFHLFPIFSSLFF